jgi:hypothetical protein
MWVDCPFCGTKLTHQLSAANVSSNEAMVALLLENHLSKCSYQVRAVDLVQPSDRNKYGYIISYLMVAHDGRVWHYLDCEDCSTSETFLKLIFADKASLKAQITKLRQEQERIRRELHALESINSLQLVKRT